MKNTELINDLKDGIIDEQLENEVINSLKEDDSIGSIQISENIWKYSIKELKFVVFENIEQAERIAVGIVEKSLLNRDFNFDEDILKKHLKINNPHNLAYKTAKKKYQFMSAKELLNDYRSCLKNEKCSDHELYVARDTTIQNYTRELESKFIDDPVSGFIETRGYASISDLLNTGYFSLDENRASYDLVSKFGFTYFLPLLELILYTSERRIVVMERE